MTSGKSISFSKWFVKHVWRILVLAIVFLFLISRFPTCMVYTMIAASGILLVILAIVFIATGMWPGAIGVFIILAIFGCFLCCYRE